jgi:hypothetical protein
MANATPEGEDGEKHDDGPPATFTNLMDVLQGAMNKLNKQNIKTPAAVQIKTEVCKEISNAMGLVEKLRDAFGDSAMTSFSTFRDEIKEDIKELVTSLKEKSYAQAISAPGPKPGLDPKTLKVREQKTATRQERAKYEITLTATTKETKEKLIAMSYKDITERIQTTINTNVHHDEKPSVFGVSKPTKQGTVRVRCETEEQAKMLRHINWESGLEGLEARQPKFGIVIHAVNKAYFICIDANKPTFDRIEHYQSSIFHSAGKTTRNPPNTTRLSYSQPTHMLPTAVSNEESTSTIAYTLLNATHHNCRLPSATTL